MVYRSLNTFSNYLSEAASNGSEFLAQASEAVERQYPEASHDARAAAAGSLALAMAVNHLAMAVSGQTEGSPLSAVLLDHLGNDE